MNPFIKIILSRLISPPHSSLPIRFFTLTPKFSSGLPLCFPNLPLPNFNILLSLFQINSFLTLMPPPPPQYLEIRRRCCRFYLTGKYEQLLGRDLYDKMSFQFIEDSNGQELLSPEKGKIQE